MGKRNFEGCWTCRSRKVRCGLEKPRCQRCVKANLECGGYDIKLGWSEPLTVDRYNRMATLLMGDNPDSKQSGFLRRHIQVVQFPSHMAYSTFSQVELAIQRIDIWVETKLGRENINRYYKQGPFSVFQFKNKGSQSEIRSSRSRQPSTELKLLPTKKYTPIRLNLELVLLSLDKNQDQPSENSIFSKTNNSWVHYELLDYAKLTIVAIKGVNYHLGEQNMLHILYPKFFPNIDSDDWDADMNVLNKLFVFSKFKEVTVFPLFNKLLNTFKLNVSSFLRVYYSTNYWEKILIPFIYKIFGEFIYLDFKSNIKVTEDDSMTNKINHTKLCIVYSVLCLASVQISNCTKNENDSVNNLNSFELDEFLRLSIELRKLTITILNSHLDEYGDEDEDDTHTRVNASNDLEFEYSELLLLGIVLQIQIDTFFSVFENYDYLYGIGEDLIKSKFLKRENILTLSLYLMSIFKYHHTFYMSTQAITTFNYTMDDEDTKQTYRDIYDGYNLLPGEDVDSDEYEESTDDATTDRTDNSSEKPVHRSIQIKPTISNLITREDDLEDSEPDQSPISFTINFSGNRKRRKVIPKSSSQPPENVAYIPNPMEMGYNHFNSELVYLLIGIPQDLIDLFYNIVQLTNHKNTFKRRKVFPRNFPKICADIEDKLLSWDFSDHWILFSGDHKSGNFILDFHRGLYHNIKSFHNSLIVYFNQLIKNLPPTAFQNNIESTLDHLKELDLLNRSNSQYRFRPSFWQILICASDALDPKIRKQFQEFWLNSDACGVSNYWRAKQIIYEVWKRRDDGETMTWMDMIREWEVVLSLA